MDVGECLALLRAIKSVTFATVDERHHPQARVIDVMCADAEGIYFCTARGKDFYRELLAEPSVAVVGMTRDFQMVRLMGQAERLAEQKPWIDRIFAENPSMHTVYPGDSRYILEPFGLRRGQVEYFDLLRSPIERESFALGEQALVAKGFAITSDCVGCGGCQRHCPQQCITAGTPFAIVQSHCLHCGLCAEVCPVGAVVRRGRRDAL